MKMQDAGYKIQESPEAGCGLRGGFGPKNGRQSVLFALIRFFMAGGEGGQV
jgi:hypothetical protein